VTALYLCGDVFDRLAELRRRRVRVALALCSPPFLALRSYLLVGHPLKAQEIGSEATPAAFIDVMLALVAEVAHVLEPWGSLAFELGDTYAGSGGAGGDYNPAGLREGQPVFSARQNGAHARTTHIGGTGWPEDKSLAGIPEAFMLSLAYGYNVLDRRGPDSPAGRWRVRNFKPWIRSNPPVGSLGDKERPATSYITVATRDAARYFDLDAVRSTPAPHTLRYPRDAEHYSNKGYDVAGRGDGGRIGSNGGNAAGAPPRDWWHNVDAVLDACLDDMAGKTGGEVKPGSVLPAGRLGSGDGTQNNGLGRATQDALTVGARGVHLRRALERAGILRTVDALDVSPKGYKGAHYATWPSELVKLLVLEMCPRRVCSRCGQPSRRLTAVEYDATTTRANGSKASAAVADGVSSGHHAHRETNPVRRVTAENWSDCGCPGEDRWRPGVVLDPFVGSGTTLQVCSGMGRDSIGIDLDYTNVGLAMERVGMWLEVEWPDPDWKLLENRALDAGSPHSASYDRWARFTGEVRHVWGSDTEPQARSVRMAGGADPAPVAVPKAAKRRAVPAVAGQVDLFAATEVQA
jgi:hypothetical protein